MRSRQLLHQNTVKISRFSGAILRSGRDEIAFAYEKGAQQIPVWSQMWVPEKVDLVIRTSGEYRISNFLPLQSGYAEHIFVDKHSVEITPSDLEVCLDEYVSASVALAIN